MRIFPPFIDVKVEDGFSRDNDIFGRKKLADQITALLTRVDQPLVLALDGPWGSGKSTFLRQWQAELQKQGIPVIYFDAFASDFHEDAFLPLASEIISLANQKIGENEGKLKKLRTQAVGVGKILLMSAARIAIKGGTLGALDIKDFEGVAADEAEKVVDKLVGNFLAAHAEEKSKMELFRQSLSELPTLLQDSENNQLRPLILIVDELDRCRPAFALQLLERIKHFFSVPNVHFVLGVNMEQLSNSVSVAYGQNTNGREYLQKFIQLTVDLRDSYEGNMQTTISIFLDRIRNSYSLEGNDKDILGECVSELRRIGQLRSMSLRTIEQVFSHIIRAIISLPQNYYKTPPLVVGLAILKVLDHVAFQKAKAKELTYSEVVRTFALLDSFDTAIQKTGGTSEERLRSQEWFEYWWRYVIDPDCPEVVVKYVHSGRYTYGRSDRANILQWMANEMIDRFQPLES